MKGVKPQVGIEATGDVGIRNCGLWGCHGHASSRGAWMDAFSRQDRYEVRFPSPAAFIKGVAAGVLNSHNT